jgi:intracellular septation protein
MSHRKQLWNIGISWGIEFGPIMAFFVVSEFVSFFCSTELFVILTALALAVSVMRDRRIALFPLIAGFSVILFGVLTLVFHNPFFIIIKDTLYNGGFAIALAIGLYVYKKPILKTLFSSLFHMTEKGWMILSRRWMVTFIILAITNEFARVAFAPEVWIKYKMFATFGTLVFGFYQLTLSRRERMPDSNKWGMKVTF